MLSKKERTLAIVCVACLVFAGVLASRVAPLVSETPDYSAPEMEALHQSALGVVFGALRVSISDLLWLKTDEYLHQGVSYIHKPETAEEHAREAGHQHAEEHEHEEQHAHGTQQDSYSIEKAMGWEEACAHASTAIPAAANDFRGILGDLERATKPYADKHVEHSRMEELIPWYRIITRVNPKHVRAYVMGGYLISAMAKNDQKALEFLEEGERNNPESPEIEEALGRHYFFRLHDQEAALKHLLNAERLYLAKPQLTEDDKETLTNAYRLMAWIYAEKRQLPEMARVIDAGLRLYPNDVPLLASKEKLAQMSRQTKSDN
jgi:hypothetical protein